MAILVLSVAFDHCVQLFRAIVKQVVVFSVANGRLGTIVDQGVLILMVLAMCILGTSTSGAGGLAICHIYRTAAVRRPQSSGTGLAFFISYTISSRLAVSCGRNAMAQLMLFAHSRSRAHHQGFAFLRFSSAALRFSSFISSI